MVITEFKILGILPSVNQYLNREKTYSEAQSVLRKILEENYRGYIPVDFPVKIVIYHYLEESNYNKEDIDNKQKIIQDAMKGIIIKDDSLICSIYSEKKIAKSEEYFTVLIEEFNETFNNNMGEIIGSIGSHKDKELKARELQLSIKDKKINELKEEIDRITEERNKYNENLRDKNSELINLKKVLEGKEKDLSSKKSAIDNHIRDKKELKEENEKLIKELEFLKKGSGSIDSSEIEKIFLTSDKINKMKKYITGKANEHFLTKIILDFEKDHRIVKNDIRNKISCEKVKKMIKEIFKISLMNDGDYLVVNKNNFENYSKIEEEPLTEADVQNYFIQS